MHITQTLLNPVFKHIAWSHELIFFQLKNLLIIIIKNLHISDNLIYEHSELESTTQ